MNNELKILNETSTLTLDFDDADNSVLLELFGLASSHLGFENPIVSPSGQVDALTHDMLFSGNSQASLTAGKQADSGKIIILK